MDGITQFAGAPEIENAAREERKRIEIGQAIFVAGLALHGPDFVPRLASALGCNPRSLQRWISGRRDVPAEILEKLRVMLASRFEELDAQLRP